MRERKKKRKEGKKKRNEKKERLDQITRAGKNKEWVKETKKK